MIKNLIKSSLHRMLKEKDGYVRLSTISGPAKGVKFCLDLTKEGSYFVGNYDDWLLKKVKLNQIIKPGWTVWDCGSYVGFYAAIFRKLVGSTGKVYAFEASTSNFNRLSELPKNNKWDNVYIINEAVGPDHTHIKFASNLGGASGPVNLSKKYGDQHLEIEEVICRGIDELVTECKIPEPDFIKFDLESAEIYALKNGDHVFKNKRPKILLELHGEDCLKAAGVFLKNYSYQAADIYFLDDPNVIWFNNEDISTISYVPHMLYCQPK
jgi:FkbM family methyltransferase